MMKQKVRRRQSTMRFLLPAAIATIAITGSANATQTYLTNFAKNNNIYTNLNEQYPHSGTGTPGTGVGTPNASIVFTPTATGVGNPANVNRANDGVSYEISSDAAGHDFAQIAGGTVETLDIGLSGVTSLDLLMSAYDGGPLATITLTGSGGATQTYSNIALPDFNGGAGANGYSGGGVGYTVNTVFNVADVGAGGTGNSTNGAFNNYNLSEVALTLGSQFSGQSLLSASILSTGYDPLLLGATAITPNATTSAVPEPASWAMMIGGFGLLGAGMRRRTRRPLPYYS